MAPLCVFCFSQGVEKFAQNYERIIARHRQRGLDRQAFVKFGKAMIVAMKDVLSSKPGGFTSSEVEAMRQVYAMLSTPMVKAIEAAQKKLQPMRPSTCVFAFGGRNGALSVFSVSFESSFLLFFFSALH